MSRSLPMISDDELLPPASSSPAEDDAHGFGALRTEKGHLPLESLEVHGRIDGLLARTVVRQTFVNAFDEPLEAAYIFPLPDRAAVTHFRMTVAGREIEGILEERGKAREDYDRAIAEGRRAAIAEEDRPGVFNLRVGNLMPGERANIELTLCGVLPYADGQVTFRFPMVIAPRYIPGVPLPGPSVGEGTAVDTDDVPDASRISPPVLLPGFASPVRLSIDVDLYDAGASLGDVRSSLHAVHDEPRDGYRRIRVHPGERLNRDFILRFRLGGVGIESTLTLHPDQDRSGEGTFALTVVPPATPADESARPRDIVFVLDRSGSMGGWKMVAARRAVSRMIDTLRDADRFGVLAFDTSVETAPGLPDGLTSGTDRNRFRALEFLAAVDARGGTEMAEPLDRAVKLLARSRADDRDGVLVLITDGQVGNEDQILATLGKRLERIRVFTLGIDRAVNEGFLRRLAERGGGSHELVESEDRLDEVMAAVHRRIGTPLLTGVSLEPNALAIEPAEIVPRRLPDLFAGSPLLILGRYRGRPEGSIAIRGTDATGQIGVETVTARIRENPAIAAAWARGQIRQLEDRYSAGDADRSILERAIVAISLKFRVLCRFTAYIAVDRSEVANRDGSLHRITQPVEMPEGWAAPGPAAIKMARVLHATTSLADRAPEDFAPMACSALPPSPPEDLNFDITDSFCAAMALPLVARETLSERLQSVGKIPPRDAAAIIAELADGLQPIHDQGLIHGEITPVRVVFDDGNHPRLQDVPVSMHHAPKSSGSLVSGVSCYTPPEWIQSDGKAGDHRGDIYAMGVILYEMLTGRCPFSENHGRETLAQEILRGTHARPRQIDRSIPAKLEAICLKAMAREPAERYATAGEFAAALREFLKPRRRPFWK